MSEELVILVDENDTPLGTDEKLHAHQTGQLHRAISVFIFNSEKKILLQKRASNKYHSGGLWTNACCSHPRPGESTQDAARRRLKEEMGIDHAALEYIFHFTYKAKLDNELTEHELDHVFLGQTDTLPQPNPDEVGEYDYFSMDELDALLKQHPERFTYWFKLICEKVKKEATSRHWL